MQALLTQGALDLLDIKIVRILHIFRVVAEHKKVSGPTFSSSHSPLS